jgi:hypothetical protein
VVNAGFAGIDHKNNQHLGGSASPNPTLKAAKQRLTLIYTLSLAHMGFSWRQHTTRAMSNTEQAAVQSGRQGDFLPPSQNQAGRAARLVLYFPGQR